MENISLPQTTFVSAFLDLREDRSKDKSVARCFDLFSALASSGIRIHLFLSRSFEAEFKCPPNVRVEWLELEDLETYKEVVAAEAALGRPIGLPHQRTAHHDTRNFFILMNAKAELVARAARVDALGPLGTGEYVGYPPTPQYSWIDFSICHVFKDVEASLNYLKVLAHTKLITDNIAFPGCWYRGAHADNLFGGINWRFCGGFFLGSAQAIQDFNILYRREFPKLLLEKTILPWEVNIWSYFECNLSWSPIWFQGDHNDSIVRVPTNLFSVVASLTTIPPRLASLDCRLAIESLLPQVDRIYLSIADTYERFPGQTTRIPEWLSRSPFSEKVVVVRPPSDYGPATKYLGALGQIPAGSWVFFCDDDQEYAGGLVKRMLGAVQKPAIYQNHYKHILEKTSGGLIHGYVGLLAPIDLLREKGLSRHPLPPAARFVDDQWLSVFCHFSGIEVLPSGVEEYFTIYRVLVGWHEKWGEAPLSALKNREQKVQELADAFGVVFERGGVIRDREPPQPSEETEAHHS